MSDERIKELETQLAAEREKREKAQADAAAMREAMQRAETALNAAVERGDTSGLPVARTVVYGALGQTCPGQSLLERLDVMKDLIRGAFEQLAHHLNAIWRIRQIIEPEPGRMMLGELVEAVKAMHDELHRRDNLPPQTLIGIPSGEYSAICDVAEAAEALADAKSYVLRASEESFFVALIKCDEAEVELDAAITRYRKARGEG